MIIDNYIFSFLETKPDPGDSRKPVENEHLSPGGISIFL